jgi:hypothetical protein
MVQPVLQELKEQEEQAEPQELKVIKELKEQEEQAEQAELQGGLVLPVLLVLLLQVVLPVEML